MVDTFVRALHFLLSEPFTHPHTHIQQNRRQDLPGGPPLGAGLLLLGRQVRAGPVHGLPGRGRRAGQGGGRGERRPVDGRRPGPLHGLPLPLPRVARRAAPRVAEGAGAAAVLQGHPRRPRHQDLRDQRLRRQHRGHRAQAPLRHLLGRGRGQRAAGVRQLVRDCFWFWFTWVSS